MAAGAVLHRVINTCQIPDVKTSILESFHDFHEHIPIVS